MYGTISHIGNWIDRAEPDFYLMFIKAWIPFNAWYMTNFYDETTGMMTDRAIINHIKANDNTFTRRIKSLLRGKDAVSMEFKQLLGKLEMELRSHPVPNEHEKLSLANVSIMSNTSYTYQVTKGHYLFRAQFNPNQPRTTLRCRLEVLKSSTGNSVALIELNNCQAAELEANADFVNVERDEWKDELRRCLNEVSPNKKVSLLATVKNKNGKETVPAGAIEIDKAHKLYLKNNVEDVAKAVIEIVYGLRCILFHGEVDPTVANSHIYEYAYGILRTLIKELK